MPSVEGQNGQAYAERNRTSIADGEELAESQMREPLEEPEACTPVRNSDSFRNS